MWTTVTDAVLSVGTKKLTGIKKNSKLYVINKYVTSLHNKETYN